MSKYTLETGKQALWGSVYARTLVILTILAMGLLIWDYIQYGNLMSYVLWGVK